MRSSVDRDRDGRNPYYTQWFPSKQILQINTCWAGERNLVPGLLVDEAA